MYAASESGTNTATCTLYINVFNDEDVGEWKCGCEKSLQCGDIMSEPAWLTETESTTLFLNNLIHMNTIVHLTSFKLLLFSILRFQRQ